MACDVKSVDIAVLAGIGLLSSKRHLLDRLLQDCVPVRFVTVDPNSLGGSVAINQFINFTVGPEREESVNFTKVALGARQKAYPTLEYRQTDLMLPCAIFIVHRNEERLSSAKIDLYTFETDDDERKVIYITAEDDENFSFFQNQFEYIWNHAKKVEL